jgi:HEAT repeat protein
MQSSLATALAVLALVGGQPPSRPPSTKPFDPRGGSQLKTPSTRDLEPVPPSISEVKGKTLKEWTHQLTNKDPSKRTEAIASIVAFGPGAKEAVPVLIDRTSDRDASPRTKAVMALRYVPIPADELPKVIKTLARRVDPYTETQAIVRYEAAVSLMRHASNAREAIPQLLHGAVDKSTWETRQVCLAVLREAGADKKLGPDARVTRALLGALRDPTTAVRMEAITGLGAMGRPSDPVMLKRVMDSLTIQISPRNNPVLVIWARVSLMSLDGKIADKHIELIAREIRNADQEVRLNALQGLAAMSKYGKPALPFLMEAIGHRDVATAAGALSAALQIDEKDPRVQATVESIRQKKDAPEALKAVIKSYFKDKDEVGKK